MLLPPPRRVPQFLTDAALRAYASHIPWESAEHRVITRVADWTSTTALCFRTALNCAAALQMRPCGGPMHLHPILKGDSSDEAPFCHIRRDGSGDGRRAFADPVVRPRRAKHGQ